MTFFAACLGCVREGIDVGFLCGIPLIWGIVYLPYAICRAILTSLSRQNAITRPAPLFCSGLACVIIQVFILIGIRASFLANEDYGDWRDMSAGLGITGGIIGLVLCLMNQVSVPTRAVRLARLESLAVTKFQIWLQDIFVATLVSGACLSIVFNLWPNAGKEVLIYELVNILGSFVLVMEFLRFQPLATSPLHRAAFVAALMLLAAIPGIWALETMAWLATTHALTASEPTR